jgi:lysophospholipase L1-like esterase
MNRRAFLRGSSAALFGLSSPLSTVSDPTAGRKTGSGNPSELNKAAGFTKPRDFKNEPFKRLVILGESTVAGGAGGWLQNDAERYADVVVQLINACQEQPIEYYNKGIGANAISPRSPGYAESAKPSALERYRKDVIDLSPDLFILAYGLNDMRADMPIKDFREDMATIIRDVKKACAPMIVLTTVYYMTGWKSWPPYDKGSVELTLKYNECIRGLADEFGCVVADVWAAEGGADWLLHYDGVHANKVGCLLIGHRIFEAIAQHASGLTNHTFAQIRGTKWSQMTIQKREGVGDPFKKTW